MPGLFGLNSGILNPLPPTSRIFTIVLHDASVKYPFSWYASRMRSLSSSSLFASKLFANRFSKMIECGMPTGRRFFIARITSRSLNTWLPSIVDVADLHLRALRSR